MEEHKDPGTRKVVVDRFALDLGKPEGLKLFHELIDKSDVLIENFRTDSAEKMGLAPKQLLARHPDAQMWTFRIGFPYVYRI